MGYPVIITEVLAVFFLPACQRAVSRLPAPFLCLFAVKAIRVCKGPTRKIGRDSL